MDIKVSQKQKMMQPQGSVDVMVDSIFDFFLIEEEDENGQIWVKDIEAFSEDEFLDEELDRVAFAVIRSRGQDPISPEEGVQWSEMLLGEIPVPLLMQQILDASATESQYVQVQFETTVINGQEQLMIAFNTIQV